MSPSRPRSGSSLSLSLVLLAGFLVILWAAGGASRADAFGQVVVRAAAWMALVIVLLFSDELRARANWPIWLFIAAVIATVLTQLIPLPPSIWTVLPGRHPLLEAMLASGQAQPWRPLSIVPSATVNAASSLVVPLVTLVLVSGMRGRERDWLLSALLICIVASSILALIQFSGSLFNNPLINDTTGLVSGSFANRNHFALFMAVGCVVTPVWVFEHAHRPGWRAPVGLGLTSLFFLSILASGSRAGLSLGVLAIMLGIALGWRRMRRLLRHYPRWVFPMLIGSIAVVSILFVALSVAADRAASISRMFAGDQAQDMRVRALPTVLAMVRDYFPVGTGFGTFDPVFRMHEPFNMLKPTYFNHAHNDLLEVVLDGGAAGALLLVVAVAWWLTACVGAWRRSREGEGLLPLLGGAILLLVIVASAFDYPMRTPMFMAVAVIAAHWLRQSGSATNGSPLPR